MDYLFRLVKIKKIITAIPDRRFQELWLLWIIK